LHLQQLQHPFLQLQVIMTNFQASQSGVTCLIVCTPFSK